MRYLVTILALVPSIAHAYFNSILNESTIYQNKIITNNYQKYAAVTLITDEQGGLKAGSLSTPKCEDGKELYNGKCEDTECRNKYPFTSPPDTNKGHVVGHICLGIKRFAYSSCKEDIGWIAEMNEYNTIHDCVERPGKEDYPLTEAEENKVADFADTSCKYFGGVKRCRINSCDDGWDAKRNSAGKIIKCEIHTCSSEYYINSKPDESIGTLLPPCKAGYVTFYGYKTCNKGYSGPVKGQCKLKTCSASDGYVYTTGPITGCKSGETCYSGSSTYHRCIEPDDGYCMDADGYVTPCQCGKDYVYNTFEIEGCKLVSEPCLSGDKTLYKCLETDDGYVIDDNGEVTPQSCEGYDYETQDIPDCLETESCLSGDKTLYKCTKPKTCDGYPFEDKSTMTCFGTIEECTVGGKTYYKCNIILPDIRRTCENIKNEYPYLIRKDCYKELFDRSTGKSMNQCVFVAKVGCPAVISDYIIGTIVAIDPKYKNDDVSYGILVAGLDTIDYTGKVTTEPTIWSTQVTKPHITHFPVLGNSGQTNTRILGQIYKQNTIISGIYEYAPNGCEEKDFCSIGAWYLPSQFEIQLAKDVLLLQTIKILDRNKPIEQDSSLEIYMTSTYGSEDSRYMYAGHGFGENSKLSITKIATYEDQTCGNDCVRKAYARPFVTLPPGAMLAPLPSEDMPSDDTDDTGNNYGTGGGGGGIPYIDGPVQDVDINPKYDGVDEGPEYFHRVQ